MGIKPVSTNSHSDSEDFGLVRSHGAYKIAIGQEVLAMENYVLFPLICSDVASPTEHRPTLLCLRRCSKSASISLRYLVSYRGFAFNHSVREVNPVTVIVCWKWAKISAQVAMRGKR